MGRLKRAAKLCCGVLERQPREEKKCDSSRRTLFQFRRYGPSKWRLTAAPSGFGTSATYRTEDVSKSSSAATSAFTRHPPSFFVFPRHNQKIPTLPPADLDVDNSEDMRTQAASPSPHLRKYNDYLCKSWMYKR